ncbi:hypothetical protein EXIGLDRAFT_732646 [Exidia glandulosa HHB12029]|uniref:Uncharacterized protein n=1 Tax=Exidia glandulosa HHB12029 TaxID=1314781 RepID=A0A166AZU9_EXIGL|nr:hypothetical protein EXIGLDRAFT_732646 [Exidia glandulosa HHB12029]
MDEVRAPITIERDFTFSQISVAPFPRKRDIVGEDARDDDAASGRPQLTTSNGADREHVRTSARIRFLFRLRAIASSSP